MTAFVRRGLAAPGLTLMIFATVCASAGAQVPDDTGAALPSPAVFGGARRQQPGTNSLNLTAGLFSGYDTNILAGDDGGLGAASSTGALGSGDGTGSTFGGTATTLSWSQQRARSSYFGQVGAQYRTFFDVDDFNVLSYDAAGGASAQITRRSTLGVAGSVGVQPFYQFGVLGAVAPRGRVGVESGPGFVPDFQAAREQVLRYNGGLQYAYALGPRSAFSAQVSRSGFAPLNSRAEVVGLINLGATSASARLTRRLTANLEGRVGYGYTQFDTVPTRVATLDGGNADNGPIQVGEQRFGTHDIDVGVDYSRALTIARRTSFSFGTGSNITRRSGQALGGPAPAVFNVTGFATLNRAFLRTWNTGLNYGRATSYVEGFNEFGVFDSASAFVGGLFTDRLDGSAGLQYVHGRLGGGGRDELSTLGAGAQLRYGISSNLAAFVSYTYARFGLPDNPQLQASTLAFRPERQGVRVGLTLWLDLLR
ncbi:MAG: hypothetical protein H0V80_11080 [Acidobacteria bacterium]|nr:hypothetical protein [Acidobacteriota bacterium]